AEDGIRDLIVTGVQTCALPISIRSKWKGSSVEWNGGNAALYTNTRSAPRRHNPATIRRSRGPDQVSIGHRSVYCGSRYRTMPERSEERRVGKECGCEGSREHEK